ncbi:MAG: hypothetical protein U0744_15590 [Gemmataceae bacterium]
MRKIKVIATALASRQPQRTAIDHQEIGVPWQAYGTQMLRVFIYQRHRAGNRWLEAVETDRSRPYRLPLRKKMAIRRLLRIARRFRIYDFGFRRGAVSDAIENGMALEIDRRKDMSESTIRRRFNSIAIMFRATARSAAWSSRSA